MSYSESDILLPFELTTYSGQAVISLTYDDGRLDNFTLAVPKHIKHRIPANFAIIARYLLNPDKHQEYMSPEICRILLDLGFELSSHGLRHHKNLVDMTLRELHYEVHKSKFKINKSLGRPGAINTYCVPFSRVTEAHVDYLHTAYGLVRQGGSRMNPNPLPPGASVTSYPLKCDTTLESVKTLIDEAIAGRQTLVLMLHGIAAEHVTPIGHQISALLLDQILDYISQRGPEQILPVRLSSLQKIRTAVVAVDTS